MSLSFIVEHRARAIRKSELVFDQFMQMQLTKGRYGLGWTSSIVHIYRNFLATASIIHLGFAAISSDKLEVPINIIFQDVAPGAVLFVMLPQKARQTIPGKVRTLSLAAGRVIVYQPVLKVRFKDVVAQTVLHHPVPEGERFYLPFLRVIDHELILPTSYDALPPNTAVV